MRGLRGSILAFLVIGWSLPGVLLLAADDAPGKKQDDQRFEALLAAAKKDPEKADWKMLRHAFAKTSRYKPYNFMWKGEVEKLRKDVEGDDAKGTETTLKTLLDREGFMRLELHALAFAFYEKTGQAEKALLHKKFIDGFRSVIFVPGRGLSLEKSIEVLFMEEEYMVLRSLDVRVKKQGLVKHEGHWFDVFTPEAGKDEPAEPLYFNIDLPYNVLSESLGGVLDKKSAPSGKK
jgi:hypothetical protein